MKLLNVKITNIFSIAEAELDLTDRGIVLITGYSKDENDSNGSGKSSLAHKAITWGLWGNTAIGVQGDRVRKRNAKSGSVRVRFLGENDGTYEITRSRNPNELSFTLLHHSNDSKYPYLNSVSGPRDCTQKLTKETQKLIDQALGRTFKTWVQTDFFGQGRAVNFPELTPTGQREVLENILPMDQIDKWWGDARVARKDIEDAQIELNIYLTTLVTRQEEKSLQLKSLSLKQRDADQALLLANEEITRIQGTLPFEFDVAKDNFEVAARRAEAWSIHTGRMQMTKASLQHEGICKVCGSTLDEELKIQAKNTLAKIESELPAALKSLTQAQEARTWFEKNMSKTWGLHQALEVRELLKTDLRPEIIDCQTKLDVILDEIKKANKKDSILTEELEDVSWWETAFKKDMKTWLLDSVCGSLTWRANRYIKCLGNPQFTITFSSVKSKADGEEKREFNVAVESDTGGAEFGLLSGGEQQLVNFAIGLALADLAEAQSTSTSKFMVLDEPFTNLGRTNCDRLLTFLTGELTTKKDTIFLVSNDPTLAELIPNRIHVEKENGTTRIVHA